MLFKLFGKKRGQSKVDTEPPKTQAKKSSTSVQKGSNAGGKAKPAHSSHKSAHKESKSKRHRGKRKTSNWDLKQFNVPEKEGHTRFHDLDLPLPLMRAIANLKFEYCSPIQASTLPLTLDGYDLVGKAQTGTGKTAAFLITAINELLQNLVEEERYIAEPRVVVIAPTRELTMQIAEDAKDLVRFTDLSVVMMVGGMDYGKQLQKIQRNVVDIVVATPGRLIDFITRGDLNLSQVDLLVIDEADRMMDMGFIPQVRRIVRATPPKTDRQTLLFSATFPEDVMRLAEQWTLDPHRVEIEPESVASASVEQKIYLVAANEKLRVLKNIIHQSEVTRLIVFANRRDQTRQLHEKLRKASIRCGLLSGEINQQKRIKTLDDFKSGKLNVLVATDVAGRGIHVDDISHVVNYNLPEDPEDYVHRIGRTGRAGSTGIAISLACEDDAFVVPDIEAYIGEKISCEQPPEELL